MYGISLPARSPINTAPNVVNTERLPTSEARNLPANTNRAVALTLLANSAGRSERELSDEVSVIFDRGSFIMASSTRTPTLSSSHEPHKVEQAAETPDHSHGHANHDYGGLSKRNIAYGSIT
jgi:hypothetical protein